MRKAQAAMEFLMTYGWAILVVLAAIAALAYFGVLSPSKMLPQTVTGFTALTPLGSPAGDKASGAIYISLKNNAGSTINITGGSYSSDACTTGANVYFCDIGNTSCTDTNKLLENGEEFTVIIHCTALQNVDRDKGDLTINYIPTSTKIPNKEQGTVQVKMS